MTYDEFCALQEEIIEAYEEGYLTKSKLEGEMEALQEQWDEEGEE